MRDIFRPKNDPASWIYDALQSEAKHRSGRPFEVWNRCEIMAVWSAARDYAQQHGLPIPSLKQVEDAEISASGHVDYGSKFALRVSELLT